MTKAVPAPSPKRQSPAAEQAVSSDIKRLRRAQKALQRSIDRLERERLLLREEPDHRAASA